LPLPLVSAIVVNYNGAHLLPDCLDSLAAQEYPGLEVLVVDNASTDDSRAVVSRAPMARWIGLPENRGLGAGYNAGAHKARGSLLFFLNNDISLEPGCVRNLVAAFKPGMLAADPLQLDWEGARIIHGAQRFRWGWRYFLRPIPFMDPYQDTGTLQETAAPWGCCGALMFDRHKFEALEGFDPAFFIDYEDLDLCWRGWLRGWETLFVPTARLRHRVGASGITARRQLSQHKNVQRVALKCMPPGIIAAVFLSGFSRAVATACRGRLSGSLLWLKAAASNLRELPKILRQRRQILREAATTPGALLKRWRRSWDAR